MHNIAVFSLHVFPFNIVPGHRGGVGGARCGVHTSASLGNMRFEKEMAPEETFKLTPFRTVGPCPNNTVHHRCGLSVLPDNGTILAG